MGLFFSKITFRCVTNASAAPAIWKHTCVYILEKNPTSARYATPSSPSTSTWSCIAASTATMTVPIAASSAPRPSSITSPYASTSTAAAWPPSRPLSTYTWRRWWSASTPARKLTCWWKRPQPHRLRKLWSAGWLVLWKARKKRTKRKRPRCSKPWQQPLTPHPPCQWSNQLHRHLTTAPYRFIRRGPAWFIFTNEQPWKQKGSDK